MTWLETAQNGRPDEEKRAKLLAKRDKLVKEIEVLSMAPISKSNAAAQGRLEDLTKLASKIKNIDKTLGRTFG